MHTKIRVLLLRILLGVWIFRRRILRLLILASDYQILPSRVFEGFKWVNGRLTKIQKTMRPCRIWPEAWTRLSKKHKEYRYIYIYRLRNGRTPQHRNLRGIDRWQKIPSRWLLTALAMPCKCEGWQPRRTLGSCNFNWCQWGTVRFRKDRSTLESEATTYGPDRGKWVCGKLSQYHGTQASFNSRSNQDTRSQSRRG